MPRELTSWERSVLDRLASASRHENEVLRAQSASVVVVEEEPDPSIPNVVLRVQDRSTARLKQEVGAIVSAWAEDADGAQIDLILFVADGWIDELQVFRADGKRLLRRPMAEDLYNFC